MVSKPEKPRPDFPLFAHNNGQWAKKILQKMWYFGPWEDPAAAEAAYNSQAKDLHAGKKPRPAAEQCTLEFLCDAFMTYNDEQLQAGQMKEVTHKDYRDMCVDILKLFGKARLADQEDFRKFANDMVKRGLAQPPGHAHQQYLPERDTTAKKKLHGHFPAVAIANCYTRIC